MIHILATFNVKEENLDEFVALCQELISKSRQEAGCLSYHLQQHQDNRQHLVFVETWQSADALALHNASAHFTTIVPQLVALCQQAPTVELFNPIA